MLNAVDAQWPAQRRQDEYHLHWLWKEICSEREDCCALVVAGRPLALWAGKRSIKLPCGRCYRLDYIEVDPKLRGRDLGILVMGIVADRALSNGAEGLVLAAIPNPDLMNFYANRGGVQGQIKGWNYNKVLKPFHFSKEVLHTLSEYAHALEEADGLETGEA